jgi:hypothetical protein
MSTRTLSGLAAIFAALLTAWLFRSYHHQRELEAAALRGSNAQLRLAVAHHWEGTAAAHSAAGGTLAETDGPPAGAPPRPAYRNDGRGAPSAALQTLAWACTHGELSTLSSMLYFQGGGRQKVEDYLHSLPPGKVPPGLTPEAMAAGLIAEMYRAHPFPTPTALDQITFSPVSDDLVTVNAPGRYSLDQKQFQRTPSGWSYVIAEVMVDNYLARFKPAPATAPH